MSERRKMPIDEVRLGNEYNPQDIEDIINANLWPSLDCKVCGEKHLAAIRKTRDSKQGGEFEFVEAECPNRPAEGKPAEE